MEVPEMPANGKLLEVVKDYKDDQSYMLELLLFLARHPCTRFSQLALAHTLKSRKSCVEKALAYLVEKGVIKQYDSRGVPVYSLSDDGSLRGTVSDMAKLDWWQWQTLVKKALYTPV